MRAGPAKAMAEKRPSTSSLYNACGRQLGAAQSTVWRFSSSTSGSSTSPPPPGGDRQGRGAFAIAGAVLLFAGGYYGAQRLGEAVSSSKSVGGNRVRVPDLSALEPRI